MKTQPATIPLSAIPRSGQAQSSAGRNSGRCPIDRAGLFNGSFGFGGEESASASFPQREGIDDPNQDIL